jgi:hypothetical protein
VRHAKPAGYIGRPRLTGARHQIGDEFDVIFQKRRGLRRSGFPEATRLGSFRGKLLPGGTALASCRLVHSLGCKRRTGEPAPTLTEKEHIFLRVSKYSQCYTL